MTEIS
jgi:hypothetical protein